MFDEKRCLENLKHIISEYTDDKNLKNLSPEELRPSYTQISDNLFQISVSNRLKYKNLMWNMDQLKPDVRSKFQKQLFNTWHSIYKNSMESQQIQDLPKSDKKTSPPLTTVEMRSEIDPQKALSKLAEQKHHESENQIATASGEEPVLIPQKTAAEKQPPIPASMVSARQNENDWFDRLIDFFAAIVGCVAGIMGR
jgi:hypothetical protein